MNQTADSISYYSITLLLVAVAANAGDKGPLSVDDGLRMKVVEEAVMSPDGDSVLFTVRSLDWAKNEFTHEHLMYRGSTQSTHKYIGDGGGEDFRFSPDGQLIAFLRELGDETEGSALAEGSESSQVFVMPTFGGEALQLTQHPGGVASFRWLPASDRILYLAEGRDDDGTEAERRLGDDAYFVDETPNGKQAARYTSFWSIDVAHHEEASRLSQLSLVVGDFAVSPEGERVVFDARPDTRTNYPHEAELYMLSVTEGTVAKLTNNAAPESGARWSPDGKAIAYRAPDAETFELSNGYFWVMDPDSGETRKLTEQSIGELSTEPVWAADGRSLLYNEIHGTSTNLYRIDIETGKAKALTRGAGTLRVHGYSAARDRMVYSYQNFTTPSDLFVSDLEARNPRRISDLNPWIGTTRALTDGQLLRWRSEDGLPIEGVFFPALASTTEKTPLIVHIHGGPAGVVENTFRDDFQILAGLGFAILAPNVRGSTGYGDAFLRGLAGEVGPGYNFDVSLRYIGGKPWDNPAELQKRSSITHVRNVSTPAIIFHGGDDETSSVGQSLMFYTALREIGNAPVRYMRFPREGHGIEEPRHRRRLATEEIIWFMKYLRGQDWRPGPPLFAEPVPAAE